MPVRFKGLSEYQRNFLWKNSYLSEAYNPSVGQKYPWAGLRSDQLGITKEPSFISKRRVPYHDPQISKSLEWKGSSSESNGVVSPEYAASVSQAAEQKEDANQEKVLLAPHGARVPKRTRAPSVDSRAEGAAKLVEHREDGIACYAPVNENVDVKPSTELLPEKVDDGLDRLLRKKVGLASAPSHPTLRNSEYQRQFVWKTPKETVPVFAANQVFNNKSKCVPQFKGNSIIHETEYKRNFKGLSPTKEPKFRHDLKEHRNLETVSPEKKCNKKDDPLKSEAEMESKDSNQSPKKLTPWRHQRLGKVNSEYRAKFLSPAQYLYKAGAWTRVKENMPTQVKELREKAEFYRKRVLGTHFSRDHLNQILSDTNCCWDVSSTTSSEGTISSNIRALDLAGDPTSHKTLQKCPSTKLEEKHPVLDEQPPQYTAETLGMPDAPTAPVRRRLAWDADNASEEMQRQPKGREEEEEEEGSERIKQVHVEELEKFGGKERSKAEKIKEGSDSSSVSSGKGGRLPTPKLRELGAQRTHHDLTTPAVGGAVLVSPPKGKHLAPDQRTKTAPQDGFDTLRNNKKESRATGLLTSPAAGLRTLDPLPLREESEANVTTCAHATRPAPTAAESPANTPWQGPSPPCAPSCRHSRRRQGSLRDPEFQHIVGKARMNNFQLPQRDTFNDEDDRLSEISALSAASSLRAFQTLARAQERKENFWGKT
ncbi:nuclear protein MDM1 isoform X1 [Echinops telfairi]|uniref:Nuclear protein MDM1 isoform X1 n=1 Tax=Echinops telfairi TaxID=9371 RepID=A0AC55D579_ECHTE|nr:nuclear protein MDM1 isoform X1 [Echinops telfairi]